MRQMLRWSSVFLITASMTLVVESAHAGEPMVVKKNGGWCWFQGQRAVGVDGKVFFTSVAGDNFANWDASR